MIYPKQFHGKAKDVSLESHFYHRFSNEIRIPCNIYYSLTLITPDVPMREIDFLVVSPYGVITIELKNGRWREKKGQWEFYNVRAREWNPVEGKSYTNPIEQVQTQRDLIREFFKNHNQLTDLFPPDYYDSAIFFLKNERKEFHLPNDRHLYVFGGKEVEDDVDLNSIIESILFRYNREPLPESVLVKAHEIIKKNLNFFQTFRSQKEKEEENLLFFTKEQFQLVEGISNYSHNLVFGSTGSGKSILAGELALQNARAGKKVLLWQGAKALYEIWNEELENIPEKTNIDLIYNINEINHNNIDLLIADGIEDILDQSPEKEVFLYLSKYFWENKNWILFISRRFKYLESPMLEYWNSLSVHVWDIKRNIRNSPEIVNFANSLLNDFSESPIQGNLSDVQFIKADEDLTDQIRWCYGYAKKVLEVENDEIVVIYKSEDYISQNGLKQFLDENGMRNYSAKDFVGMEETCGIIIGYENWNKTETRTSLAETILKIRSLVCVFYPPNEEEVIQSILKKGDSGP